MMERMTRLHKNIRSRDGFTLIETVMVITIIAIIGATILVYFAGVRSSGDPVLTAQAANLAEQQVEQVLSDKQANGFASIVSVPAAALPAPFNNFTRQVDVVCVQEADLNTGSGTMPACADSDIQAKNVKVTVSWASGSVNLATVITNH